MSSKLSPYVLQELADITEAISYPLKSVQRIKYTCFDVSRSLIVFGATSGGIYIFNRITCEFLQLIPNKDGAITRLAIAPDEKHIGYANGRGVVTVTESVSSTTVSHSITSKEHQNNEVTAMTWSANNMLFIGDDVGRVSVLQLQSFIAKTIFQSSTQTIMSLDSRICQMDVKDCMLLISTFTRCYICDTHQEQYRQIGQKLRDGEYGACFVNKEVNLETNNTHTPQNYAEVKQYNIVPDDSSFGISEKLKNTLVYCARPSSRLWEATIDGNVRRTHQFKKILANQPKRIITWDSYTNENVSIDRSNNVGVEQSVNFAKIYSINGAIFTYKKDAIYFLNIEDVDDTVWFDFTKDIVDCKMCHDIVYVWFGDGSLLNLKYMKYEKFLLKCFFDEKFALCSEFCALYKEYLLNNDLPVDMHILSGLKDKISDDNLNIIKDVLNKFQSLKLNEATQMKSGIYVVENTYMTQSSLDNVECCAQDKKYSTLSPDALQAIKDIGVTFSDKFSTSKKILKDKLGSFEEKMKYLGTEKQIVQDVSVTKSLSHELQASTEYIPIVTDTSIVYKESSQKAIDNIVEDKDKICKSLYQYFRLSLVGKEMEQPNLIDLIESKTCDINEIYDLMLSLEDYCKSVGALEESKYVSNNIFLNYLNASPKKPELLNSIINDEILYKYFVDSCIIVNLNTQTLNPSCKCGYPLPYGRNNQIPSFSELIDDFIERQWLSPSRDQCYDICKKMPYLWRKILHLRKNEDLMNLLKLLLQMLDENLLHKFLPQFTLDTWDKTIDLYAILHGNVCLNCSEPFKGVQVCDMLDWDEFCSLIIKSLGGKCTLKVIRNHANLIRKGEISMKFYHTCLVVAMYEVYDATITNRLTDALYCAYEYEEARIQIIQILKNSYIKERRNTALPIIVAANTEFWGLSPLIADQETDDTKVEESKKYSSLEDVISHLTVLNKGIVDCALCGLELGNEVLIKDGGLWVFKCGHIFHGACLIIHNIKLCPSCTVTVG